jgi:hypothetical protein
MKFLRPTEITDAVLISSNVAEDDHAEWSAATTYAAGTRVILAATHRIYQSVQAGNLNHPPASDDATWWVAVGYTNRWKMFDKGVGSQTEETGEIVVEMEPGLCNALALLDVVASSVQVEVVADGATLYDEIYPMGDSTILADWFEYFFEDITQSSNLTVVGLPVFSGGRVTVTITPGGATAKCGTLAIGRMIDVGRSQYGATVGIIDYSRKSTDDYGNTTVIERSFARRVDVDVLIDNPRIDYIVTQLAAVRAAPAVWIADTTGRYGSMTIYGFFKDFGINIAYPQHSHCSIQIEGLT